ncbi:hypothetical protein MLD38_000542 [Melastoma candidum]|uniref:Uncharacterized protein n=1 Tax=Melastoma candidum TaxID=119954 RepID=A0ACB9SEC2_9MYRT|nr:hypothetical protein MLD38_000542 [Melastoma candidum]
MDNGRNGYGYNYPWSGGLHIALREDDYEEAEVWSVLDDGSGRSPAFYHEDEPRTWPKPKPKGVVLNNRASESRGIPRRGPGPGALKVQKSAPMNISYWPDKSNAGGQVSSSSSGKNKKKETRDDSEDDEKGESEDEEEGGWETRLPPHEIIARRMARGHVSSFSVLEGMGRKLKGRDLAKVRRAVLTRTGFLESP